AGLSDDQIQAAEDAANEVIFSGTVVHAFFPDPAKIAEYEVRKQPDVLEDLRLVRIGDFDISPCSGTHVRNSAEVGVVFVTGSEKISGGTKVSFLCGARVAK